jgi:hypothetical protein
MRGGSHGGCRLANVSAHRLPPRSGARAVRAPVGASAAQTWRSHVVVMVFGARKKTAICCASSVRVVSLRRAAGKTGSEERGRGGAWGERMGGRAPSRPPRSLGRSPERPGRTLTMPRSSPGGCPSKKRGWLATDSSPVRSVKNPRNNFRVASLPWIGHDPAVVSPQDGTSPRSAILPSPEAARSPNAGAPGRICGASRTELTPTLGQLTPQWARGMPRRPSVVVTTLSVELEAEGLGAAG